MGLKTWALVTLVLGTWLTRVDAKELPQDIQSLLDQEKYSAAVEPLKTYLEKEKKSADGWAALGLAYYFTGEYEPARDALSTALEVDKKHWLAVHGMILTQKELAMHKEADELARWAVKNSASKPETQAMFYHDLGLVQLDQEREDLLDSADINFRIAIGQAPDSCQYRLDLGEIYFARKIYPMAISQYDDVLNCDSSQAGPVYHRIAKAYLYQRDFDQALKAYQQSAEARPKAETYSDLGDALILKSRSLAVEDTGQIFTLYRQAIAAYQKAKENDPEGCRIFEKLGKAEALMGHQEAAVEDFRAAINCGSENPDVFFALANVLIDLHRYDEALAAYDRYENIRKAQLEKQPWGAPDADYFANRGLALRSKADSTAAGTGQDSLYNDAIESYRRALELDSTRANILGDLGIVLFNMKRYQEAIPIFERKIMMEPELTNGYLNLAYCYLQLKQYEKVLSTLDRLLAVDSCNAKAFEIGGYVATFELKNYSTARQWYSKQLACDGANCDAKMYTGYTYIVSNDTAQIRKAIPILKDAYECRMAKGNSNCGDNTKQNALWVAEGYLAIRDLEQAGRWSQKVLDCEPGHKRAKEIKKQAESEY